ncbi:biotin carboxylase N-terminal domain-containing protein [Nocardioides lianchengensis]|uniref:3-methylcrotonyl-CoA carboxylase alpha subunit/acetyl-CoA/propionyl-CoA carboxylase, biotin carboxylase, biotin carboxyl carrier protein n=1 Tax=Nocardioides lianchengensis TaxID=1045774 RepID=A0A1G6M250_9ACTN|nr:biotin carboxylase N-terminal domain-containing protein [Nocardioides lianchengensis]NYG12374.1 3-methylcrotonyl-CoA carboxylase alpha subunit/acetyl-CoA/propionyl-CoA carboxylase biotin carboxyl carrier protein [Nocardioides lianchengensis]SDC49612.1 3-methylcrotonyl-CoA carboxylase alpha subunit/acetyl-CoA/propionyl-CoA carboxylase, biotin carboxylase, biotin carboxyl carrier protein [Nocardioides lianchengensis]
MKSVFIANRGEIAVRIARTCARLGLASTVATGDYLDVEAQVAQALAAGADAVHPGYGFLSENAGFARAVIDAGLAWVGPPPSAMEAMARKDVAREVAVAAGVPVVPTDAGAFGDRVAREERAGLSRFPVLVKAAAGGGGKGMRVVRSAAELDEAVAAAKREALAAFGDDTILIETYVERGRHVEVQVMADAHGTVLHLFERDCSTQRRHQKVLEEAPAPTISAEVRELVLSSAVALAREVGYVGAGTVEFLVDEVTGAAYFLEMNTRLQVEHPVTEAITGLDLVELQLRVAAGESLGLTQDDVRCDGHAIEARIYAEDAFGGFLPQAGTTSIVRWPEGVRVDHDLASEQVVSTSYDPMLGKVVVHGPDREAARAALVDALDRTAILGLTTNTGFLRALAASDAFRDATIDTAWLDRHTVPEPDADLPRTFVAWVSAMLTAYGDAGHPFQPDGFRLGGPPAATVVPLDREVLVDRAAGTVDGVPVRQVSAADHVLTLSVAGDEVSMVVNVQADGTAEASYLGQRFAFERPDPLADHGPAAGDGSVTAPMPGTVLAVGVAVGDVVAAGDPLGILEAMKMELTLRAPFAGTVAHVDAAVGRQVALGARLFHVEPGAAS